MRTIPDPGFADDDGSADPRLATALHHWEAGGDAGAVLGALEQTRLLVPVVAVLGEVEYDGQGLAREKTSDMAAVLMRGADGRLALLSFTSTATLQCWDPQARPVPVRAALAARAALQDDAAALVIDVAGPTRFAVEGEDLAALAAGWRLTRVGERTAWLRPSSDAPIGPTPQ